MRALPLGLWGVPGAPAHLHQLDAVVMLRFLEHLVREGEDGNAQMDRMWADALRPPQTAEQVRESRRNDIAKFAKLTGGATG